MKKQTEKENFDVQLTKDLYLQVSADKTSQIAATRQEKDNVISQIKENIKQLKDLRKALKEVKNKIKIEKRALSQNRQVKWALTRELSKQNRFAKRINKAYTTGEETVNLKRFYTAEEQKTR